MTIKEAQEAVDQWIKEYGVRYFSELTNRSGRTGTRHCPNIRRPEF